MGSKYVMKYFFFVGLHILNDAIYFLFYRTINQSILEILVQ